MRDPFGGPVGHAGDDHPPVAPTHQDDAGQVFVVQQVDDVLEVGVQINLWAGEVDTLAKPGEGRREDLVTRRLQFRCHPAPAPAADERALDQDEGCRRSLLAPFPSTAQPHRTAVASATAVSAIRLRETDYTRCGRAALAANGG